MHNPGDVACLLCGEKQAGPLGPLDESVTLIEASEERSGLHWIRENWWLYGVTPAAILTVLAITLGLYVNSDLGLLGLPAFAILVVTAVAWGDTHDW